MAPDDLVSTLGLPVTFPRFFPTQLEQYRRSIAEATDTPDDYAIGFMLAAAATAAGAEVSACVQPGWCVRSNMFLAVIGFKGSSKSTLAEKAFAPLFHREDELRADARRLRMAHERAQSDDEWDEDEGDDEDGEEWMSDDDDFSPDASAEASDAKHSDPCIVLNDCTGPALLKTLGDNCRQLLVNPDELSAFIGRNTGGGERQLLCELYDGRRRRRERVSRESASATLAAPYVSIIGSIQPDLFKCFYNTKGDDGLLDRFLLVGDGVAREAEWPRDADDPVLNVAWSTAISRLLRIEECAADAIGGLVESRFTESALEVCKGLLNRLNNLVVVLAVPDSQRGIVKKLVQHAVKLALLHRVLRWATGEFGEHGPLGDVDAEDATAAREATLFFLGRWLRWRKELLGRGQAAMAGAAGLSRAPGDDAALQTLAAAATGAQRGLMIIERLVRLLRDRGSQAPTITMSAVAAALADVTPDELRSACDWLVDAGHAVWPDASFETFHLLEASSGSARERQEVISTMEGHAR